MRELGICVILYLIWLDFTWDMSQLGDLWWSTSLYSTFGAYCSEFGHNYWHKIMVLCRKYIKILVTCIIYSIFCKKQGSVKFLNKYLKHMFQKFSNPIHVIVTRNPSYKKRSKKWASLDLAFFVQSFLIFQVDLVKSFLVSSRFIKISGPVGWLQ